MSESLKVAYILLHFPYLTETFVAEEIEALKIQGAAIRIVSLLKPGPGPAQSISQALLPQTWYAPGILNPGLWWSQIFFFFKSPIRYLRLFFRLLTQPYPRSPLALFGKRLIIYPKAVASAYYLKKYEIQLLHAHFAWLPAAAAWIIARLLDLPFTVTMHAYEVYAKTDLLPLLLKEADHIVSISEYNSQRVRAEHFRVGAPPISVIHCGVDLSKLAPAREAKGEKDGPLRILSVGSLVPKKGYPYLIKACQILDQQGVSFTCSIIGGGFKKTQLDALIRECGLEGKVKLLGALPHADIVAAYREHDLFALASVISPSGDRDGIPVVLMEAGAMGLPLVSTEVSGIPELVRHQETGWLVPPEDPKALAQALAFLSDDPELGAQLGQKAKELVRAHFNIEVSATLIRRLFHNSIRNHKQKAT